MPSDPNYVLSVYPEGKEDSDDISKGASSIARLERAQHQCKMALEQQRLREEEVEYQQLYLNYVHKASEHASIQRKVVMNVHCQSYKSHAGEVPIWACKLCQMVGEVVYLTMK